MFSYISVAFSRYASSPRTARRGCLLLVVPTITSGRCIRPSDDHVRCQGRRLLVRDCRSFEPPRAPILRNLRRNRRLLIARRPHPSRHTRSMCVRGGLSATIVCATSRDILPVCEVYMKVVRSTKLMRDRVCAIHSSRGRSVFGVEAE